MYILYLSQMAISLIEATILYDLKVPEYSNALWGLWSHFILKDDHNHSELHRIELEASSRVWWDA